MAMRTPALGLMLALGAVPLAGPVGAQAVPSRTVVEAFRDSLQRATDSSALASLETRMLAQLGRVGTDPDPYPHLRLGFLSLRLGELGATSAFEDAAMEFQTVTRLVPHWPYGWYGLGLAEYQIGEVTKGLQTPPIGLDPSKAFERASDALARSAATDPAFVSFLLEEANLGRRLRMPTRASVVLHALRKATLPTTASAPLLLGLGRVEREYGDPAAALRAFDAVVGAPDLSLGLSLLEVARTRFLLGRQDGGSPYYEGAVFDDAASVSAYRVDLVPIATVDELDAFDGTTGARRAAFLKKFWSSRDLVEFREEGSRLREHYRRLYVARRAFPRYGPLRHSVIAARRNLEDEVDDRGVILIRHGEPDDRVDLSTLGFEPNESWRYVRAEGDLVLHFTARRAPDEFTLVESLFDVAGARDGLKGLEFAAARSPGEQMLLRSREQLSPLYRPEMSGAPDRERKFMVAERAMGRTSLITALSTDTHRRRYAESMDVKTDLAIIGRTGVRSLARLAVAVRFESTGASWLGEGLSYPVRFRFVALDPEGKLLAQIDSTIRPVATLVAGERYLAGVTSVPLPPGRMHLRMAFEDERRGTVLGLQSLEVPGEMGDAVQISDLTLGPEGGPWVVAVGAEEVQLNPLGVLRPGRDVELAFQVSIPRATELRCQITVIRADEQPGVAYSRQWTEQAEAGTHLARHVVELDRLTPGLYRVEVTVTAEGGLARRWREFTVSR